MGKLLIIGASVLQLPAILKAKECNHYVAVVDYNPHAIGISYADEYFNASTIDESAVCDVAKEFKPDGIMTLATDMPMRSVAAATQMLGLPGISYETAIKATDKYEMIKAFKKHDVSSPWYFIIHEKRDIDLISDHISYPCIIKPTDNAGSRGVALAHNYDELISSYSYSKEQSRHGEVIIEEYLSGDEVSVEVMVVSGKVHILAITDKLTTGAPHFVEMGHSQPSRLDATKQTEIATLAEKAVKSVGINCGPAHVEMMETSRGPVMIELGARMGGDCITTHLVPLSTGIDMVKATIDIALGKEPDLEAKYSKGAAIRYFDVPKGEIKNISGIEEARLFDGVKEIVFSKHEGDDSTDIKSSTDRVGYIISQADSGAEEALDRCSQVMKKIIISIQ